MSLKVIKVEHKKVPESNSGRNNRTEVRAKFERLWLADPDQFDPQRKTIERERIVRTLKLIKKNLDLAGKKVVDLGCGLGCLSKAIRDEGAEVHAVDIASNALEKLKGETNIRTSQELIPKTTLEDDAYDCVISTDVLAFLPEKEHRLYFNELSRLIHRDGTIVCSTPLDYRSEDCVEKFIKLAQTEFEIVDWVFSFHQVHIRLVNFFKAPARFIKAKCNQAYRTRSLDSREGFKKRWFKWNSGLAASLFWRWLCPITNLFVKFLENRRVMLALERLTRESGVTHVIIVGKRRKVF